MELTVRLNKCLSCDSENLTEIEIPDGMDDGKMNTMVECNDCHKTFAMFMAIKYKPIPKRFRK